MWKFVVIPVFSILVLWTWQFLNWAWFKPRKIERLLRKQGMKGNSYKFLFGDSKETSLMYEKALSKPIGVNDDITPRVMPNILDNIQKYGNYSFSWSGPRPRIFINDTAVARDVLNKYRVFLKTFVIGNQRVKLLVTGLATLEGDQWTKSRSMLNPSFNMSKLKPMVPAIQSCCEDALNTWKEMISKEGSSCVVDVFTHLEVFTSSVMAQLMFSSTLTEEIKRTFLQLGELAVLAKLPSKIFTIPGDKYLPTQTNARAKEIDKYVKVSLTSMVEERLKRNVSMPNDNKDLLDALLEELYEGKVTKKNVLKKIVENAVEELRMLFFGGFETTSNLLTWAMVLLSVNPEWQARARKEVFQVLGNKKEITSDDLNKIKIITMIVNETLRLYPPVMEYSRLLEKDTMINDFMIPKDSLVTFPILIYQRRTDIWGEDAGEFRPDRFAEGVLKAANGEAALMPFGWGPRICVGMNLALLEAKTFLAMLVRELSFEISPTYTHAPTSAFTIHPQFGAPLMLMKL